MESLLFTEYFPVMVRTNVMGMSAGLSGEGIPAASRLVLYLKKKNPAYVERLEKIKEEARHFAELPEPEFNALVLQARTFSLAPGRRSSPFTTTTPTSTTSTDTFSINNSSSMSGPQHSNNCHSGSWSGSTLATLADDTSLEQNGIAGDDGCCPMGAEKQFGMDSSKPFSAVRSYGKRPVTNHFAPHQQKQHHIYTQSSPKHEGWDPVRRNCSSPLTVCHELGARKASREYVDHDDVRLDLDPVSTLSADEDSGLPRSSSSHKASSSCLSDNSQDDEDSINYYAGSDRYCHEQDGDDEERQSLLHGRRNSVTAERPRERSLVRVSATCPNPPHDEEIALNTSTGSSEYVESPRSDTENKADNSSCPKSFQMDTLAFRETPHPADRRSPTPMDIHGRLYGNLNHRHHGQFWHYDNSNCDEDESYSRSYDSQRGASGGSTTATTTTGGTSTPASFAVPSQVDVKIPFLGPGLASPAKGRDSAFFSNNMLPEFAKANTLKGRSKVRFSPASNTYVRNTIKPTPTGQETRRPVLDGLPSLAEDSLLS
ncbi:hypothetical protein RRG08_044718 [Elysia crispata]|uniref:Uncharacterized protein n=1 Tax=Elysia crispata TaxID=231223 RepID=A0AAE0XWS1_9GAST|nr:hypothetical protein RRG08_044718 [Elysia crispata]